MATADRGAPLFDNQRDYNHATDNTYKNLRDKADQMYEKRKKLSNQSQQAYQNGDKQKAHELSEESKKILAQAENYNRQAAEYVFRENNADSAEDEIDLHGLYVKEAEWIMQKRLSECIRTYQSHLRVIVGKGLHSANGIAKLKPAIEQLCQESGLKHYIDPKNTGVMVIDLANSQGSLPSHWDQQPLSQGSYYQQQQPQYQQQQQGHGGQNQFQNIKTGNSLVDGLLRLFCQCINK
ncbi:uncharacterized protein CXQ87_005316 [Candidozyma duobushaemuli]|uniref:Smr domain-containing protein n=2 Tax=Candidozyma TaxID=3303203 RepID=A0ABX8I9D9_9ASCO|nr:uncharacterized protein CXQ87_005316 [[Candida] duobushaemulonis]PVH15037.1 hypothetical protein CXQ87_005316 [[Candida] duobushaemulonis]QWU89895.1 hypothetical protein CA3LBN_004253 [[Candida] haemuloni]